jgi:glycosyltransferase involved in cell wall biosynthesis
LDTGSFNDPSKRNKIRSSLGISDTVLAVGMVACFKPQKASLDFIELAGRIKKNFPDVKFVLVGNGDLYEQVKLRVKQLNLEEQIILTGWRNDIPLILSGLDVFVLTSLWEGLPIVALEAMAAQVALAATDTGGIKEVVVNGENGYLVKPHDILSMQNCLEELLTNRQKREEFVKRSRQVISSEDFLLTSMFRNTEQIYSNLLQEKSSA